MATAKESPPNLPIHSLLNPIWLIASSLYIGLFILKKAHFPIPWISWYLADLLSMPVILGIILFSWRISSPERSNSALPPIYTGLTVAIFGLLFEGLFPILTERFTADPWDILCYTLGALFFCQFQNKPKRINAGNTPKPSPGK